MSKKHIMTLGLTFMLLAPAGAWAEELFDRNAAEIHFQKGLRFYYEDQHRKAMRELETAIMINPDDVRAFYFLGYTYYRLRDMQKAQEAFDQAYRMNPEYSPLPAAPAK